MTQTLIPSTTIRNVHRTVLDNGIVLLVTENPAADIIATRLFLRTGSRWEPQEKSGLSHLLATVLTKGTNQLSSLEIAEQIESVGAKLNADTSTDYFLISLKTVASDFENILNLTAQLLRFPSFPEDEIELERRITIQGIRSQREQPFSVAFEQLRHQMYQHHPYALSTLGTEASVSQLSRADLQEFHQTYFRPDNLIISIAGRITPEAAMEQIERVFGDWIAPQTSLPTLSLPTLTPHPQSAITPQETQQSVVMLGYLTSSVNHEDYSALKVLNTYLGNGLSSRLFVELREKRGLAYDVSAFFPTRLDQSQFVVYMGTAPENTDIAIEGLRTEVERLVNIPLTPDDLQVAKNKLLGQYALGKQTNSQLAQIYGWYECLGLGIEFDTEFQTNIAGVTSAEALRVANHYFIEPYLSVVGPEAFVSSQS
ncbi:putative zinc protease YmxG [Planktothrix tepida]|uniref:Peptidase M16 domain protein n=2 Tax=Planktothrix TaxID=54304 RepID=A0A1J1LHY4_9CYAN|nr:MULTISPECIES: pitrilysin family protein [Planktothrix]CAD5910846.1 putative zinc protease YmxG [Planktothrix tepida]CAD5911765.1 putative zinc protease YmxG [Planktothrix pseudagardhii]CUR32099.1 Peptidase M16 domain protein [Planktothrix tepida PCC 9214]